MLFSRPLIIDSTVSASETRARIRAFATSRDLPDLDAYRRRQIIGWRLSKANEDFLFQPEYGDTLDVEGTRFVGLVEPTASGSRIRGFVVLSPLTRIIMTVWILAVLFAMVISIGQGSDPAGKVLGIGLVMLGGAVMMIQYSLRSTSQLVEARLRQCLEASGPRAAA